MYTEVWAFGKDAVSTKSDFAKQSYSQSAILASVVIDAGLLALFSIGAFAFAFAAFLRYDVR